jgi:hypothetical protein
VSDPNDEKNPARDSAEPADAAGADARPGAAAERNPDASAAPTERIAKGQGPNASPSGTDRSASGADAGNRGPAPSGPRAGDPGQAPANPGGGPASSRNTDATTNTAGAKPANGPAGSPNSPAPASNTPGGKPANGPAAGADAPSSATTSSTSAAAGRPRAGRGLHAAARSVRRREAPDPGQPNWFRPPTCSLELLGSRINRTRARWQERRGRAVLWPTRRGERSVAEFSAEARGQHTRRGTGRHR